MADVLPDLLAPGLQVVFCGSAAGRRSAEAGAYYAGPGNKFWPILATIGLTPRVLKPSEFTQVLEYGIGLTDLAKDRSGADSEIEQAAYDPLRLKSALERCKPQALVFNGKRAGQLFCGGAVDYGLQPLGSGSTAVFVLPSTSGAARRFWDEVPWRDLANWLRSRSPDR